MSETSEEKPEIEFETVTLTGSRKTIDLPVQRKLKCKLCNGDIDNRTDTVYQHFEDYHKITARMNFWVEFLEEQ